MAEKDQSAEKQLSDAIWGAVSKVVLAAALIGSGLFAGYYNWGHATELEQTVAERKDDIVKLKNERETLSTRIARFQRDLEVCQKELKADK
jgi:outer membrane murein-binding lipoprotein Lpp